MKKLLRCVSLGIISITTFAILGQANLTNNKVYATTLSNDVKTNVDNKIYNFKAMTGEKLLKVQERPNVYKADICNNQNNVSMQFECESGVNPKDFIITGSNNTIVGIISEEQPILTINNLKDGLNTVIIRNSDDNSELYKFYINFKSIKVGGLKNVVNSGETFKLDAIIDGKVCKNVEWTSIGMNPVIISKDGYVTTVNNGIANIMATIYDNNKKNIIGTLEIQFNVCGDSRPGWVKNAGKWYYIDESMKYFKIGWFFDHGNWYYLNNDGSMKTGWLNKNNQWYYLNTTGDRATGWVKDQDKWYFLDEKGIMKTGWIRSNGNVYYLNSDGTMQPISK